MKNPTRRATKSAADDVNGQLKAAKQHLKEAKAAVKEQRKVVKRLKQQVRAEKKAAKTAQASQKSTVKAKRSAKKSAKKAAGKKTGSKPKTVAAKSTEPEAKTPRPSRPRKLKVASSPEVAPKRKPRAKKVAAEITTSEPPPVEAEVPAVSDEELPQENS